MAIAFDEFFFAYTTCAIWASVDEIGEPLNVIYNDDGIAPDTLAQMRTDCAGFLEMAGDLIGDHYSQAGHDFWLTRNRHGAGFWDRGTLYGTEGEGRKLTDLAHRFGSFDLYIDDDGMINGQ